MSSAEKDLILAFSGKSNSVITRLFFAYAEIHQKICSLRKKSAKGAAKISSVELNRLSAEVEKIHKNILALREVLQEAFCQGFAEGLRSADREDLLSSYPNVKRIAGLGGKPNLRAD